jgi:alpha-beta hydrolase superfamily lysophospholipase
MNGKYKEWYIKGFKGVRLFCRAWEVEGAASNVVFIHGFGDHSARYGHFAAYLNNKNVTFYTFDLRGHGKSEGVRWNVENFDFFVKDLDIFMREINNNGELKNIFFIGYSMGSTILIKYLIDYSYKSSGAILISPAFGAYLYKILLPDSLINVFYSFVGPAARALDSIASLPIIGSKIYDKYLTHNTSEIESFKNDPLVNQQPFRLRMGLEISKSIVDVKRKITYLDLPILILYGKGDCIVPTREIRKVFVKLQSKDKKLIEYSDLYHDLLHEVDYEKVYIDIVDWILKRANRSKL